VKTIPLLALASVLLGSVSLQAADLSGVWQGGFFGGPIYLVLHQDGGTLSGTAGPGEKNQPSKLENVKLEDGHLTASAGPLQLDLRVVGETLTGDLTATTPTGPMVMHLTLRHPGAAAPKPAADLKFEAASVKQAPAPEPGHLMQFHPTRSQFVMERVPLRVCIAIAYGVRDNSDYAITGPAWLKTEFYDITAKIPPDADSGQTQTMLQNLLAERFKLAVHRETKEFSGYALVQAKGGFKLKEAPSTGGTNMNQGPGSMKMTGAKMGVFAGILSRMMDRPVEDETGVTGTYDIALTWTPPETAPGPGGVVRAGGDAEEIAAALPALGLNLEARKLQKEILVVDHVEKVPVEN
jgi:uncharacterized protein (TIGR03435 family)